MDNGRSEKADVELGTDGIEDSADQQRAEQPLAMAPKASIPYRLAEMTMFLRRRKPLNLSMVNTCFM